MRRRSGDSMTHPNGPIRRHMLLTVQISVEDIDLHVENGITHTYTHTLSLYKCTHERMR